MCYGSDSVDDVPDWYKAEYAAAGGAGYWAGYEEGWNNGTRNTGRWWMADNDHPLFAEYFTAMVASFGQRFDGDPRLDSIDLSFSGYWGEGMAAETISIENITKFCDAYLDNFKQTPLMPMCGADNRTWNYIRTKGTENNNSVGWRANSFGDLGYAGPNWNHMRHFYPQSLDFVNGIIPGRPAWHDGPISFESAYQMKNWVTDGPGASGPYNWDVEYIFNKGLEWHISTWNDKSGEIPENYMGMAEEFIKRAGYRFAIDNVEYTGELYPGWTLHIKSLWSNLGVAPLYHDGYALAYRLKGGDDVYMFTSEADIRKWMPGRDLVTLDTPWESVGDIEVSDSFELPVGIKPGEYEFQVAIIDAGRFGANKPAIKLANESKDSEGWYTIGGIIVKY